MVNKPKIRGTRWESAIVAYLQANGWVHAERRSLNGGKDRGDIAGVVGLVIEAKDCKSITLASFLDEANTERDNDNADLGVAWVKRRGKASPADAYVVMDGEAFVWLLKEAGFGPDQREAA